MRKIWILLCATSFLAADNKDDYFKLLEESPFLNVQGEYKKGEIEIVLDRDRIGSIEKAQADRLVKKGVSLKEAQESTRIGIVAEDVYWIWVRDAVLFPTGAAGTYDRLVWKSSLPHKGVPGVAVLPVLTDGRIALNLNYRHATRSWELELPRGMIKPGETHSQAAQREVEEETGLISKEQVLLGVIAPDSGVLSSTVPIFLSRIDRVGVSDQEESEAILGFKSFTLDELKKGLQEGGMELEIHGVSKWVPLRDCFLTYALFQAMSRGLL